ncbi:MAG TPA: hypothetical protein VG410_03640 [Solirubrobacteraceae bacterium]|jgi:hypothetical protein|nr:hypothetical protein [Solirubrobacteraceae bacterium]
MKSIAGVPLWKWTALAAAVVLLAIALLTTDGSSPAVATVDGQPISLSSYRDWLRAAAVSAHAGDSAVPAFVPDAPSYSRCIVFERAAAGKGGSTVPSESTLRSYCNQIRVTEAEEVMQFLLDGQWFVDQGAREGLGVSAAQVQKALHTSFPKTTGLSQFLNSNGLNRSDLEFEARAALLAEKLTARHSGPTPTISSAQIDSYYNKNRSQIGNETLAQATPAIRQTLISTAQAPAFDAWMSKLQKYFQPLTDCAAGYRIAYYCRGALK